MGTLDDIPKELAAEPSDEKEKERRKKRNLLAGLAAPAVIGGPAVCLGTGAILSTLLRGASAESAEAGLPVLACDGANIVPTQHLPFWAGVSFGSPGRARETGPYVDKE